MQEATGPKGASDALVDAATVHRTSRSVVAVCQRLAQGPLDTAALGELRLLLAGPVPAAQAALDRLRHQHDLPATDPGGRGLEPAEAPLPASPRDHRSPSFQRPGGLSW